jgi:hypothetical protein
MDITIGNVSYRVIVAERNGQWHAHAVRTDTGDRYGVETSAHTDAEATTRLMEWLEWQHEHTRALDALQQAEREYHRARAGAAFAAPQEGEASDDRSRTSLEAVDAARVKLDEVRGRRPSV